MQVAMGDTDGLLQLLYKDSERKKELFGFCFVCFFHQNRISMFSVESLIATARYCQGTKTSLNFSGIYLLEPELSLESEVVGSSQCRGDAIHTCLLGEAVGA